MSSAATLAPMKRPPALRCSRCHKPIRKGDSVVMTMFARHAGVVDGQQATDPWLTVVVHLREGCMGTLTPEVIRLARLADHLGRQRSHAALAQVDDDGQPGIRGLL